MTDKSAREALRRPYHRVISPDGEYYLGEVLEFPGCFALGDTPEAALQKLEAVAESWILSSLAQGQSIPEPIESLAAVRSAMLAADALADGGFAVVPKEPTEAMLRALSVETVDGEMRVIWMHQVRVDWSAMLAASNPKEEGSDN